MAKLQASCYASDARLRIRVDYTGKARMLLGLAFAIPFSTYMLYNMYAPYGVM